MCGFVGIFSEQNSQLFDKEIDLLRKRTHLITHRGPDDEGYFAEDGIFFGFRRLSIIDIESGHQPLSYQDGQIWMIFNGEIYNYKELREDLAEEGYIFHTESDTEVIAALFAKYKAEAFSYLRGMFGIMIWDKQEETLYGARDPFGIKPFYYEEKEDRLICASERKSITLFHVNKRINESALQQYFSFQFVPEPDTLIEGIKKLEPGHYFTKKHGEPMETTCYWKASFRPVWMEKNQWIDRIQNVLYDSIEKHMQSDVPVGSFLSGGIDSSIIVSMARQMNPAIKTFSVGFEREGYSEVDVAQETAEKLDVTNTAYMVAPEEYVNELPKIVWHMDDPLADPSCIPLYFVAKEARQQVKVVLSGEGADELFGGYNIYKEPGSLRVFQSIPAPVQQLLGKVAQVLPEGVKGKSFLERGTTPLSERYIGNAKMFEKEQLGQLLQNHNCKLSYRDITRSLFETSSEYSFVDQMQYIDIHTWLRGDILLKADRMTMANSLELRVPFLDKEVFKVASELPEDLKIANGTTKHILREAVKGIVPDHVLSRKKLGFPVPIRHWLKNELYDWAVNLIRESEIDQWIKKDYVLDLLEKHCTDKGDYSRKIWTVLIFAVWHQVYIENKYTKSDLVIH
ncbi:asparagine synthase (glutamine-hydrolyzing) [Oceanobacillus neutriphilus]|uniref:asparagine synthase (glutamine-hydrolyzing) n=1 Tax=Oceanobacillus neutriphilus TaxID=531815 RepID=A0ABQ2P3M0_9BACI|nr:asparagine synthase (glutamine-hydrolyzing) [Oceanobacillus neutriphilus]GGP16871.1 asparagine synthetase B [Oceanobacillus neutriphilus]